MDRVRFRLPDHEKDQQCSRGTKEGAKLRVITGDNAPLQDEMCSSDMSGIVVFFVMISLLVWNTRALHAILNVLNETEWRYAAYFDDIENFLEYRNVFSFFPHTWDQLRVLFTYVGINVYEPVGSVLKAAMFDIFGENQVHFRMVTAHLHFANGIVLGAWTYVILKSQHPSYSNRILIPVSAALSSLFVLHPLNVEVVAWLSAQSYTLALTFFLSSCLTFEHLLSVLCHSSKSYASFVTGMIIIQYFLSTLSKGPGISLPVVHFLRVLFLSVPNMKLSVDSIVLKRLSCYFGAMLVSFIVAFQLILVANVKGTQQAVVNYTYLTTKITRAIITVWHFIMRVFSPIDLRVHYELPPEVDLTIGGMLEEPGLKNLYSLFLVLILTFVLFVCYRRFPVLLFSWLCFLVAWLPGVGIVNHGWSTFGSDRYCYIPLAMLFPGFAEVVMAVLHEKIFVMGVLSSFENEEYFDSNKTKKRKSNRLNGFTSLIACGFFSCLIATHKTAFISYLRQWKNDKLLMASCLRFDPQDWFCHHIMSWYYLNYEQDYDMYHVHHDLALLYMPDKEPKSLLCKAAMYIEREDYSKACSIYSEMNSQINSIDQMYWPYVLNNKVVCSAMNGIDFKHIQSGIVELENALAVVNSLDNVPMYTKEGVENHLLLLKNLREGDNMEYGVYFLF